MPRLLFKFLGLICLLLCCTAFGFLKANSLKCRLDSLQKIKNGSRFLDEKGGILLLSRVPWKVTSMRYTGRALPKQAAPFLMHGRDDGA